jgi:hypothetical protein
VTIADKLATIPLLRGEGRRRRVDRLRGEATLASLDYTVHVMRERKKWLFAWATSRRAFPRLHERRR